MRHSSTQDIIKDVLQNHWDWTIPVDLKRIAARLNIAIEPLFIADQNKGLSGMAEIRGMQGVVRYNPADPPNRQRFTIAHELGHLLLGHVTLEEPQFRDNAESFSAVNFNLKETSANDFAANLLMPEVAVKHFMSNGQYNSVATLAQAFQVSEAAMYYRLRNLGLL